jgi:hypothetical protein
MKTLLLVIAVLFSTAGFSQQAQIISIDSVQQNVGKEVTLVATVYGVKETEKVTYINLGAAYPKQKLTIVVLGADKNNFKKPFAEYDGKKLKVTGTITVFKDRYEIKLHNEDAIQVEE